MASLEETRPFAPRASASRMATVVTILLLACAALGGVAIAEEPGGRRLSIEPSTASAALGQKARLSVDPLSRQDGKFIGSYQIKVTPLGIGSEKGRLSVSLSDEALRNGAQGAKVAFKGEATNEKGKSRAIEGEATPAGPDHGSVRLRVTSEKGKLTFNTAYRLEGK